VATSQTATGQPWHGTPAVVLTTDRDQAAAVFNRIRLLAHCRAAFGDADALCGFPESFATASQRADRAKCGALGGIRTPSLLIRSKIRVVQR